MKPAMINKNDERIGQYATRRTAQYVARMSSASNRYKAVLTTTYRNLEPRSCWTIAIKAITKAEKGV